MTCYLFCFRMEDTSKLSSRVASSMSFFPSLCVVRSLPTLGHILSNAARERSFTSLYEFRGYSRVKSGLMKKAAFSSPEDRYIVKLYMFKLDGCTWMKLSMNLKWLSPAIFMLIVSRFACTEYLQLMTGSGIAPKKLWNLLRYRRLLS